MEIPKNIKKYQKISKKQLNCTKIPKNLPTYGEGLPICDAGYEGHRLGSLRHSVKSIIFWYFGTVQWFFLIFFGIFLYFLVFP